MQTPFIYRRVDLRRNMFSGCWWGWIHLIKACCYSWFSTADIVYIRRCDWVSEVKRSMTNEGCRVCVWYQCQGVCFCVQPAVSLNSPTCIGPTVIHSLSGNLQYHSEIKRSLGRGRGDDETLRPSRLGLLRAPDSSYQPAAALLTGCVQRGRAREELRQALWRGRIRDDSDTQ